MSHEDSHRPHIPIHLLHELSPVTISIITVYMQSICVQSHICKSKIFPLNVKECRDESAKTKCSMFICSKTEDNGMQQYTSQL